MAGPVTKEDLWDLRDTLSRQNKDGFDGVHERLDVLNGRVGKNEVQGGEHGVRLINLEREVFKRRRSDTDDEAKDAAPITRRDLTVALATLSAAGAIVTFLWKVLPAMLKALAP